MPGYISLRSRKDNGGLPGDRSTMCCQIPPHYDSSAARVQPIDDDSVVVRIWAGFVTGIVLVSLSLLSAVWLASRFA